MASVPIHAFLEFFIPVPCTIFFSKPLTAFPHYHFLKTMDSGERGVNPIAMTIINPWKEYWPIWESNQLHPVLKSGMLQTELGGSAERVENILEKGENGGYQALVLSLSIFFML